VHVLADLICRVAQPLWCVCRLQSAAVAGGGRAGAVSSRWRSRGQGVALLRLLLPCCSSFCVGGQCVLSCRRVILISVKHSAYHIDVPCCTPFAAGRPSRSQRANTVRGHDEARWFQPAMPALVPRQLYDSYPIISPRGGAADQPLGGVHCCGSADKQSGCDGVLHLGAALDGLANAAHVVDSVSATACKVDQRPPDGNQRAVLPVTAAGLYVGASPGTGG
jgi:hypothetical protein